MLFDSKIIPYVKIRINGKITKAINAYRDKKVPMRALLTDYLAVMSKYDALAEAENPWAYYYKGIEGHEVESGVSLEETLFRFSAMALKDQKPSDVIEAAFYTNKARNDSDFELGYLLPFFMDHIDPDDNILIVNPSPRIVCTVEESGHKGKRYYAVVDKTIAKLYGIQFRIASFCTLDSMHSLEDIDAVLIINRDQKVGMASQLLECLSGCTNHAKIIGLVPCAWFDNPLNGAYKSIEEEGFAVKQLLLVDSKVTASTPRKKAIILLERGEADSIETFSSSFDGETRWFSVDKDAVRVDSDSYLKSDKTILACLKDEKDGIDENEASRYLRAEEYEFSNEISLFYKIYPGRKNRYAGVAYYKEIKSAQLKKWGKKISADIEKGLRSDSREGVIEALESLVFDDALYPVIRADIREKYIDSKQLISLKSLWHFCWIYISDKKNYDHMFVVHLFSHPEISEVYPQIQIGKEIINAIAKSLDVDSDDISYKAIIQIDMILKSAMKHGLLQFDPLETYVADYTRRATERQQDVRNALVKKHYTPVEEMKIFSTVVAPRLIDGRTELSCTLRSTLLAVAIRLFTGMSLRETAALNWGDFIPIDGTDDYQFKITKFVDENGKVNTHLERENWNRFRMVPSARVLSYLLNERKRFLLDKGVKEDYLQRCPIILQDERIENLRAKRNISHCKPGKISALCKEVMEKADVPVNEVILPDEKNDMITDLNKYHGDIFISNFRDKANHSARLTMGEINYMTGIDAPDTFSRHYSDYSNDFLQLGIIQKLCRWEWRYELIATGRRLREPTLGSMDGDGELEVGPFLDGAAAVDIIIDKPVPYDVLVSAYSTHGIVVKKTVYEGEKDDKDRYR